MICRTHQAMSISSLKTRPYFPCAGARALHAPTRRDFVYGLGASLGSVAFSALLADEKAKTGPLAPKPGISRGEGEELHLPHDGGRARATSTASIRSRCWRNCISRVHPRGKHEVGDGERKALLCEVAVQVCAAGQSGAWMSEPGSLPRSRTSSVSIAAARSIQVNHPTAMYQMNCGNRFGGDPAIGSWVNYGLGSVNQDLPGFIVLPEISYPQGGSGELGQWLPARAFTRARRCGPKARPFSISPRPQGITRSISGRISTCSASSTAHAAEHPGMTNCKARMDNYELAFRMQMQVPEDARSRRRTRRPRKPTASARTPRMPLAANACSPASSSKKACASCSSTTAPGTATTTSSAPTAISSAGVDQPIAALIADLKQRGCSTDTLIVWCGEFGRTPDNGVRGGTAYGRDHNPKAMTIWLAGGGCKAGHTIGATDDSGMEAVEGSASCPRFPRHLLRLLGLDDNKLTFYHGGRFKQLGDPGVDRMGGSKWDSID
jgi:hypothetical protein